MVVLVIDARAGVKFVLRLAVDTAVVGGLAWVELWAWGLPVDPWAWPMVLAAACYWFYFCPALVRKLRR